MICEATEVEILRISGRKPTVKPWEDHRKTAGKP